jgi:hypothetical protein
MFECNAFYVCLTKHVCLLFEQSRMSGDNHQVLSQTVCLRSAPFNREKSGVNITRRPILRQPFCKYVIGTYLLTTKRMAMDLWTLWSAFRYRTWTTQ